MLAGLLGGGSVWRRAAAKGRLWILDPRRIGIRKACEGRWYLGNANTQRCERAGFWKGACHPATPPKTPPCTLGGLYNTQRLPQLQNIEK